MGCCDIAMNLDMTEVNRVLNKSLSKHYGDTSNEDTNNQCKSAYEPKENWKLFYNDTVSIDE